MPVAGMDLRHRLNRLLRAAIFAVFLFSTLVPPHAQSAAAPDALFKTIQGLDTQLFDAYNLCDLNTMASMVSDDLEFYHDKTGLAVGKQVFIEAIKNNICGKVTRELIPGSLEVYPLANYGAVEIGIHRFHHPGDPTNIGEAKFIHIWHNTDGKWVITRVISYDHEAVPKK